MNQTPQQTDWGRYRYCPNCELPSFDVERGECDNCPATSKAQAIGYGIAMAFGLVFWALVIWAVRR